MKTRITILTSSPVALSSILQNFGLGDSLIIEVIEDEYGTASPPPSPIPSRKKRRIGRRKEIEYRENGRINVDATLAAHDLSHTKLRAQVWAASSWQARVKRSDAAMRREMNKPPPEDENQGKRLTSN